VGSFSIIIFFIGNYMQDLFTFQLTEAEMKIAVTGLNPTKADVLQTNIDEANTAKKP